MNWSLVAAHLPESPGHEREQMLLSLVKSGPILHPWAPLRVSDNGHTIDLEVSQDALAIGTRGDAVRIAVSATLAQHIADHLDALLLTPRVSELIHQQASVRITPSFQKSDAAMGNTSRFVDHSHAIDKKIAAHGGSGLTSTVGKDWVLTNRLLESSNPNIAANYGWHTPSNRATQPVGIRHDRFHVDYSQTWRGMRRACMVDGAPARLDDVLRDPTLAPLLSAEGVLRVLRVPGVPSSTGQPSAAAPRTLRRDMTGSDVAAWQRFLGIAEDGIFGPNTEVATKAWQAARGLVADGVVGARTRSAAK